MPWSPLTALWVFFLQLSVVTLLGVVLAQMVVADVLSETGQSVLMLPASSIAAAGMTLLVVARRYPGQTWRLRGPAQPALRDAAVGLAYGIGSYIAVGFLLGSAPVSYTHLTLPTIYSV